jgi:hypothetical protein
VGTALQAPLDYPPVPTDIIGSGQRRALAVVHGSLQCLYLSIALVNRYFPIYRDLVSYCSQSINYIRPNLKTETVLQILTEFEGEIDLQTTLC